MPIGRNSSSARIRIALPAGRISRTCISQSWPEISANSRRLQDSARVLSVSPPSSFHGFWPDHRPWAIRPILFVPDPSYKLEQQLAPFAAEEDNIVDQKHSLP